MKILRTIITEILTKELKKINENKFVVYHGTNKNFSNFDYSKITSNTQSSWNGRGFYFSDSKSEAGLYGSNLIKATIELNNPLRLDKLKDSSILGSGIVKLFAKTSGLKDLKFKGISFYELNNIITKLEKNVSSIELEYSEGIKEWFKNIHFSYEGKDYEIMSKTKEEISNRNYINKLIISKIIYENYGISGLPIRVSEAVNPSLFTNILLKNGYDGVIAPNSTLASGNEYVVFDKSKIDLNNHSI